LPSATSAELSSRLPARIRTRAATSLPMNPQLHRETFAGSAAYLTPGAGANLHELGIEASRSWRGACVWAALKQLGREGVVEMVSRCCELAQELATLVEESQRPRTPSLRVRKPRSSITTYDLVPSSRGRRTSKPDGPEVRIARQMRLAARSTRPASRPVAPGRLGRTALHQDPRRRRPLPGRGVVLGPRSGEATDAFGENIPRMNGLLGSCKHTCVRF
jgi:hypothetical protein